MTRVVRILILTVLAPSALALSACATSSAYGCKAPPGVQCQSVSGTYYNAVQHNLPGQRNDKASHTKADHTPPSPTRVYSPATAIAPAPPLADGSPPGGYAPMPLRTQDRVIRLWIKPWEDADHDLWDQGYVFVEVDGGHWLLDRAEHQVSAGYVPVRASPAAAGAVRTAGDVDEGK